MIGVAFMDHEIDEYRRIRWEEYPKEVSSTDDVDNDAIPR